MRVGQSIEIESKIELYRCNLFIYYYIVWIMAIICECEQCWKKIALSFIMETDSDEILCDECATPSN